MTDVQPERRRRQPAMQHDNGGNQPQLAVANDPAIDPIQLAARRAEDLTRNICDEALRQLTETRNQTDDLMRAITVRRDAIFESIAEFAGSSSAAMKTSDVIKGALQELQTYFPETKVVSEKK